MYQLLIFTECSEVWSMHYTGKVFFDNAFILEPALEFH